MSRASSDSLRTSSSLPKLTRAACTGMLSIWHGSGGTPCVAAINSSRHSSIAFRRIAMVALLNLVSNNGDVLGCVEPKLHLTTMHFQYLDDDFAIVADVYFIALSVRHYKHISLLTTVSPVSP